MQQQQHMPIQQPSIIIPNPAAIILSPFWLIRSF
jgi:hypothetical protein